MAEITRAELERLYQTIDAGFLGVHSRLDKLNGKVGDHETDIEVLKDRGTRDPAARVGAGITAAIMIAVVIWKLL